MQSIKEVSCFVTEVLACIAVCDSREALKSAIISS
jgi:hypothetical protein